jgi:mono/diheme cytochrome c family protein
MVRIRGCKNSEASHRDPARIGIAPPRKRTSKTLKAVTVFSFAAIAASFALGAFSPNVSGTGGGPGSAPVEASGAELFENNCARCHGSDGKGGKGPNLASEKRQAKWRDSDAKLIKKITGGGFIMPSFGKKLKPDEIKAIADHVRTLKE